MAEPSLTSTFTSETSSYIRFSENLVVSYIKIEDETQKTNQNQIESLSQMLATEEDRESTTVFFNDFNGEIDTYYFLMNKTLTGSSCSIYRKHPSQTYYDYICTLDKSIEVTDYNIHNRDNYEYLAVVATLRSDGTCSYVLYENKDKDNLKTYTATNWCDWSICNIEETTDSNVYMKTGNVWQLGLNLQEERLTQNLSISTWDTLGRYPKVSMGERNYISSTVTCLLGSMRDVNSDPYKSGDIAQTVGNDTSKYMYTEKIHYDNKYARETEKLAAWNEFCEDGSLKLLKDIKGNSWIVQITGSTDSNINVTAANSPTTITFTWSEVLDVNDVVIVG